MLKVLNLFRLNINSSIFITNNNKYNLMDLIYKNEYGATYHVKNSQNPECEIQLVVDTVGLFMSRADLVYLLGIVQKSHGPCGCSECGGKCDKIWCKNPLVDICLKVDEPILHRMEDLIKGTQFTLNMDATLKKNRVASKDS